MDINEDVPEYVKYHDLIEELKRNKDIKGIQKYVNDHIISALIQKTEQTLENVIQLLDKKYGRSRTEQVKEAVEEMIKFREDHYEEDDDVIMALRELNQRRKDLKITFKEFISVWMLGKIKRRNKMESFKIQALRDIVKAGGEEVIKNLKEKFIEL